jgi:ribonuclease HII
MKSPNLKEEKRLWKKGFKVVVGLDEAGRGPLAGPVVAAAVSIIPNSKFKISKIRDSKKLTPQKREELYRWITQCPFLEWGIGKVSEKVIDRINIFEATKLAMKKAIFNLERKLKRKADFLILEGNFKIDLPIPQKSIIKGDEKVLSCAMASIIAKVTRDKIMEKYAKKFPEYGFEKHKGYGTKFHLKMLKRYGPCPIHRRSFLPVAKI